MGIQNNVVFELYKPLRNQIRKLNLIDSLYVIWVYSRNLNFDLPFPPDTEFPNFFYPYDTIENRRYRGIREYEQVFLIREFILNCDRSPTNDSIKKKDKLSKLVNYIRFSFGEEIDKRFGEATDVLLEFNRLAHKQFIWQKGYSKEALYRNYKIFNDEKISVIVKRKLNLTPFEIYLMGFYFVRTSAEVFMQPHPYKSEIAIITNENIASFFEHFSMPIDQAREELKECQEMNENIFYSKNPLEAKPILTSGNVFFCPIPLLLFFRITNGLYYSIVGEGDFNVAFGSSFQNYIGELMTKCITNKNLKVVAEEKYGKEEKRTSDWLLVEKNALLFIECKAKRMTQASKSNVDTSKGLDKDLQILASGIAQLYKTYNDYTQNKYPHLPYDADKSFFPIIVTLEDWYVNLNPSLMLKLRDLVVEQLDQSKIDISIINRYPYHINSTSEFERDIQLINALGISTYFEKRRKNEIHEYVKKFDFIDPFKDEFKKTFLDQLPKTEK